jgi:hypothetical protein
VSLFSVVLQDKVASVLCRVVESNIGGGLGSRDTMRTLEKLSA